MGLDMYLKIRKTEDTGANGGEINYPSEKLKDMVQGNWYEKAYTKQETWTAMYWRKANAIHKYFVDKCADGVDDCRNAYVSIDVLNELQNICMQVMIDHEKAPELLPTEDGFLFGGTEYDDYYFDSVKETYEAIVKVIDIYNELQNKAKEDKFREYYEIIYVASW